MRVTPAMFVGLAALTALSVQAAPNKANWVDLGATPPLDLVPKAADMNGSAPVCGTTGVIGIEATASPMDMTTTV
jgi:hypothetical protein